MSKRQTWLILAATCSLAGCAEPLDLGSMDGAFRDAGTFTPRTDECGNGIDDDRNGRIDDGCWCGTGDVQSCFSGPYPGHGVGACRDGRQTCDVQEFGDWGAFSCTGETLPVAEVCGDEIDNDCDGAVDEDCPCTASASRPCSDEFATAPCMPGTQTCRAGTWSRCEGAVVPSADVCGDAIDNDCDGLTNEGCTCVSTPEQCNDRIDNDCDGDVDEVTCAPLPDAGVPLPDAGVDAPIPMGVDAPISMPDAGMSCGSTSCLARPPASTTVGPIRPLTGYGKPITLASDGTRLFGSFTENGSPPHALNVSRLALDGTREFTTLIETNVGGNSHDILWVGDSLLVAFGDANAAGIHFASVSPDTGAITHRATLESGASMPGAMAFDGTEVGAAWTRGTFSMPDQTMFQRRARNGDALGPLVTLPGQHQPTSVTRLGNTWFIGARSNWSALVPRSYLLLVRDDAPIAQIDLEAPAGSCAPTGAVVVAGCGGVLSCWREQRNCTEFPPHTIDRCQLYSEAGVAMGAPVVLFGGLRTVASGSSANFLDLNWTGSEYLLHTEYASTTMSRADSYAAFSPAGELRWSFEDHPGGYEYGDIAEIDGCQVAITQGSGTAMDGFQPRIRRICSGMCE